MAKKITAKEKSFKRELIEQSVTLSTSAFGFVTALAWNEAIQAFVKEYIQKYYPAQAGVISKVIYAVIVTLFAVLVTYQLSKLASKFGVKR